MRVSNAGTQRGRDAAAVVSPSSAAVSVADVAAPSSSAVKGITVHGAAAPRSSTDITGTAPAATDVSHEDEQRMKNARDLVETIDEYAANPSRVCRLIVMDHGVSSSELVGRVSWVQRPRTFQAFKLEDSTPTYSLSPHTYHARQVTKVRRAKENGEEEWSDLRLELPPGIETSADNWPRQSRNEWRLSLAWLLIKSTLTACFIGGSLGACVEIYRWQRGWREDRALACGDPVKWRELRAKRREELQRRRQIGSDAGAWLWHYMWSWDEDIADAYVPAAKRRHEQERAAAAAAYEELIRRNYAMQHYNVDRARMDFEAAAERARQLEYRLAMDKANASSIWKKAS